MILCVDAGATSSKWSAKKEDGSLISGRAEHFTGHIFDEIAHERVREILRKIKHDLGVAEPVTEIVAGVTGLEKGSAISDEIARSISSVFDLTLEFVQVVSDIELAYASIFAPTEGILIYAGTGSIAISVDKDGNISRAGGWGFHNGDDGGGYSIGRDALRYTTSKWDHGLDPFNDPLSAAVLAQASSRDWGELRSYVYGGGRSAVGELALAVAEAARSGSEEALDLLLLAGRELANLGDALRERLQRKKFAAMGGTFKLHPVILKSLTERLGEDVLYVESDISLTWLKRHR